MSTPAVEKIISETRALVDQTYHRTAPDSAIVLSLATQLYLARKKLTEIQCPHCLTVRDHLYPAKL